MNPEIVSLYQAWGWHR